MGVAGISQKYSGHFPFGSPPMQNSEVISIIISVSTFLASIGGAAFVTGIRWGKISTEIITMNQRLAKIEGMFTLTLRDGGHHNNDI